MILSTLDWTEFTSLHHMVIIGSCIGQYALVSMDGHLFVHAGASLQPVMSATLRVVSVQNLLKELFVMCTTLRQLPWLHTDWREVVQPRLNL